MSSKAAHNDMGPTHSAALRAKELISRERLRQITDEEFDEEHDAQWTLGELGRGAWCYFKCGIAMSWQGIANAKKSWPKTWRRVWLKHGKPLTCDADRIKCLVKSGALIEAEIDRLCHLRKRVFTELEKLL